MSKFIPIIGDNVVIGDNVTIFAGTKIYEQP
jgi:acetyltransferase-like isoleucine patch superfamily enzyme